MTEEVFILIFGPVAFFARLFGIIFHVIEACMPGVRSGICPALMPLCYWQGGLHLG